MPWEKSEFNIFFLNRIDSTNNFLKDLLKKTEVEEGTVILAGFQTSGRGQGSNTWYGKPGRNIAMSMLFKPKINATKHFFLSEFISLAIIDTLYCYKIDAKIKWPNDIYVGNKKIAGILIENNLEKETIYHSIAGIGLNVNESSFPQSLPNAVSMKTILKHCLNRQILVDNLIRNIMTRYQQVVTGSYIRLHSDYNNSLFRHNTISEFKTGNQTFKATLKEVSQAGELILMNPRQEIESYLFGDVQMAI